MISLHDKFPITIKLLLPNSRLIYRERQATNQDQTGEDQTGDPVEVFIKIKNENCFCFEW